MTTSLVQVKEELERPGHRIRHIPIIDEGGAVGLISIGDIVKALLEESKYDKKNARRLYYTQQGHKLHICSKRVCNPRSFAAGLQTRFEPACETLKLCPLKV